MKLTDMAIRKARATERPLKLFDGGGLFLLVEPAGGKLWRYRYRFGGAERKLSIGKYPDISLLEARRLHQEAREQLARGIDPGVAKQARKKARADLVANTFEAVAREWFEVWSKDKSPGHSKETLSRLEKNVFPVFGRKPAAEVRAADALEVCRMFEKRGSAEMSHRILTAISQVMRYAVVTERAERNPCQDLRGALQPSRSRPLPSITDPSLIAGLLHAIDEYSGSFIVRSALQLAPLVFVRPGELRNAKWADMDTEKAEWVFRYSKQRANVEDKRKLVVPLSGQAVAVLERLRPLTGGGTYVFPGLSPGGPISGGTINKALRTMGYDTRTEITGHGFRAMARTVIAERLHLDTRWIELQLSHRTTEVLGESYDRAQYLDDRRKMMQAWADYLDGLKAGKAQPTGPAAPKASPPRPSAPPPSPQERRG